MKRRITALLLTLALVVGAVSGISANEAAANGETETNLARGKTVTTSSSLEGSGWSAAKVTDGIRGAVPGSNGWTSSSYTRQNHKEWITIDLGSITPIGRVDLYSRQLNPITGAGFPIDFTIQVSNDDGTWMTVKEVTGYQQPGLEVQTFSFRPIEARYVKIESHNLRITAGEYRMQFSEIEVYSKTLPDKPSNGIHANGELKVNAANAAGDPLKVSFYKRNLVPIADLNTGGSSGFDNVQARAIPAGYVQGAGDTYYSSEATANMAESDDARYSTASLNSPYQRFDIHIEEDVSGLDELNVTWEGRTDQTVTLYAWDYSSNIWVQLKTGTGNGTSDFTLLGRLIPSRMVKDQTARLMVGLTQKNTTEPAKVPSEDEYDFSFVWMTDTQFYSKAYPHIYDRMSQWIVDQEDDKKIKYVLHTGDLVDIWNSEYEWQNADKSMKILDDANIPYGVVAGNHDINATANDYTNYWRFFGSDRFEGHSWYGGNKDNNRHHFDLISAGGMDFIILYIGVWGTLDNETIAWANEILTQYKDRYAIVGTHAYIDPSGKYGINGKDIMEKIVAPNENVFMTVSGHYHGAFYNVKRIDGHVVYEVLSDYQAGPEGGLGYLRLLQFDAESKRMYMNTYSPYVNDYNYFADELESATFPLDVQKGEITLTTDYIGINRIENELLGMAESVPGGTTASIGFEEAGDSQDGWFAIAEDQAGNSSISVPFSFDADVEPGDNKTPYTTVQVMPQFETPVYVPEPSQPAGTWTNYALNKKVMASSDIENWGWAKAAAVDGLRDSKLTLGWTSYSDIKNNHTEWFTVDMGRTRDINTVDLYPRNDGSNIGLGFPYDFTIQVSNDNANWTTVVEKTDYPRPASVQSFSFPLTAARFVKIEATDLSRDSSGNYHLQFAEVEVYSRDSSANPEPPVPQGEIWHGWYSPATVTLSAFDDSSGLSRIEYSRDGGASWLDYSGPFTVSEEGIHTILYRSTDKAGNAEQPKTLQVKIDKTLPVTSAQTSAEDWTNEDVTVTLSATDNLSGAEIQYSRDGGATWIYYSIPFVVSNEGVHNILYRSVDNAGNVEPFKTLEVKIDKTAPELNVLLDKEKLSQPNHKLVTVTASVYASDSLSGVASWTLTSITSNEPDNTTDDGNTDHDIQNAEFGADDTVFDLRAERSGSGSGRVYTVTYNVTDLAGNISTAIAHVVVPLNGE